MYKMRSVDGRTRQGYVGMGFGLGATKAEKKATRQANQAERQAIKAEKKSQKTTQKAAEKANAQEMKQQQKDLVSFAKKAWKDYVTTLKAIDTNLRKGALSFDTPLPVTPGYDAGLAPALEKKAKSILLNRIPTARLISQNLNEAQDIRSANTNYAAGYLPTAGSGNPGTGDSSGPDAAPAAGQPDVMSYSGGSGSGPGGYGFAPAPEQIPLTYDDGSPVLDEQGNQVYQPSTRTRNILIVGGLVLAGLFAWKFMKKKGR